MLAGTNNGLFDVVVDGGFDGAHEAGAHVDTASAQAQRGREALAVGKAARGNKRNLELLAGTAEQDEVCDVRLADVPVKRPTPNTGLPLADGSGSAGGYTGETWGNTR